MTDSILTSINLCHLDQGIQLFQSQNEQYRMSKKILSQIKDNPAYQFLRKNYYFNKALKSFRLKPCVKKNHAIRLEIKNDELSDDYIVLLLMGSIARPMGSYLGNKESNSNINVIKKTTSREYANKLLEVLEFINLRPVAAPLAEYLEFERSGMNFVNKLRDSDFSEHPARQTDHKFIFEKTLVHDIYALYFNTWKVKHPSVIENLAKILLDNISENTMARWLKAARKRAIEDQKVNSISIREHKINDKYFR